MRRLFTWRRARRLPLYVTEADRAGLRAAGRFNAQVLDMLRDHVRPGVSTGELDRLAETYIRDHRHLPACFGYKGFPRSICTSVNQVVCHGIPGKYELRDGDIVNIDCTTIVNGWYGDSSETFLIGDVSEEAVRITQAAFDAMWIGIRSIRPYSPVIDIGRAISRFADERGLGVVENFQGHGIGRRFHQDPGVPHYPLASAKKDILFPGVSFTIEPMLNLGCKETHPPLPDGWTIITREGCLSAQFEHQILMTEDGPEVLTLTERGPQEGHRFEASAAARAAQAAESSAMANAS
ncbi:MAG: type I methionyl aminopeptidase [Planctomycetaceae bacterium]|nr:type I methionyl aminopeptidase [Planctomycetaceae bacterium]